MEIESSVVAAQNGLTVNPTVREPQREAEARQQQEQQKVTELPRSQVVTRQGSAQDFVQADKYREQRAVHDQPNSRAKQAISAYQSLQRDHQQSEIHQSLGVDTYV
ncbi:hypothetical protein QX776_18275 [Alteromonadaceae bacterium BrNp21-10]|nr:hypothetical protein [Alteromonadaceae bacterium BrNp21-10]